MTTGQFVSWLIENEWDDCTNRLIQRLQKQASVRYRATAEEIDYTLNRGLDRNQIMRLSDMTFVTGPRDRFITGSGGTDKNFIATALGYRACQKGMKTLYASPPGLWGSSRPQKPKAPY